MDNFYDFLAKITGPGPQIYSCIVGFSAKCTILGKNPIESLCKMPIDKFCKMWYNGIGGTPLLKERLGGFLPLKWDIEINKKRDVQSLFFV